MQVAMQGVHSSTAAQRQAEEKLSLFRTFRVEMELDFDTFQNELDRIRLKLQARQTVGDFFTFDLS